MDWTQFINWKKDFVGKGATEAIQAAGISQKLVTMTIDVESIDVSNDEAILKDGVGSRLYKLWRLCTSYSKINGNGLCKVRIRYCWF